MGDIAKVDLLFKFGNFGYLRVASTGRTDPAEIHSMLMAISKVPVTLEVETPSRFTPASP